MTLEERKIKVAAEILNLLKLYGEEEEKITAELKQTGKYKKGLDSNSEAYVFLNREFDKKFSKVFAKYDLPPDTKLKLW